MKPHTSQAHTYANLSFRVPHEVKEEFTLLAQVHGKKGVDMFSLLVKQALQTSLTNLQLRSLPVELRTALLTRRSKEAKAVCEKFANDLALDDLADDLPHDDLP